MNYRPPSPTSLSFSSSLSSPITQKSSNASPSNLASVLVEIQNPEDIEKCVLAKTFRDYLMQTDEEGLLDFVIVCNVLRNKESDVKLLRQRTEDVQVVYIPSKDAVLNKDRRDMIEMLGDTFFNEDCIIPLQLNNQELVPKIRDAMVNIGNLTEDDEKQSEYLSTVFSLVWQARCDYKVWKKLEMKYKQFLSCKQYQR